MQKANRENVNLCNRSHNAGCWRSYIREVLVDDPEEIWNRTNEFSGITKDFFDTYYKGRNKAVAYKVENVKKYIQPKTLEDFGVSHAPQSFVYV